MTDRQNRDRQASHRDPHNLAPIVTNPSGSQAAPTNPGTGTSGAGHNGSGSGGGGGGGGAGGFFSKLIGRTGSTSRASSSDAIPFHRTRSDASSSRAGGYGSGSSHSGSPATSPVIGPVGGRDKRKSHLGSAEVIRGNYDRDRKSDQDHDRGISSVQEQEERPGSVLPQAEMEPNSEPDISLAELVGLVKGDSHLSSVPGEVSGLDQVEAIGLLGRRLDRARDQGKVEQEIRSSIREELGSSGDVSEEDVKAVQGALGSREQVLELALPLCAAHVSPKIRSAGFELLAAALRLDDPNRGKKETTSSPHTPWMVVNTILDLPIDLPRNLSFRYNLSDELPSSQTLDLAARVVCLAELTEQGKDISINLDMIKVLVRWLNLLSAEWVKACSRGSAGQKKMTSEDKKTAADSLSGGTALGLGISGMHEDGDRVRSSRAGKDLAQKDEGIADLAASEYTLKTVILLSDLLLEIMKNNLALFTPNDTSYILNLYLDTIKRGIRHTPGSHPLLGSTFSGYGRPESTLPEPKAKAMPTTHDRTSSVLSSLRKPTKALPATAISTDTTRSSSASLPPSLSRHPSTRSKGEKGFATTAISTGGDVLVDLPDMPEEKPFWSTLIPSLIELTRMLLKARSLSPLDLPAIISLLSLCLGWRAISTHSSFRLDGGDRALISNALELGVRDAIVNLVRDIIVSRMVGRSGEKALRGVLAMDRGRGREKSTYHVGRDEGLRGRDRLLGVICLIRELLKSTHHAHTRADSSSAPLNENFKLASFSPSLLSAMRFSHSGASAHTQDFADAWHDIDLEILGIVDDHLKNLDQVATARSASLDQSMSEGLGVSHGRDNQSASSQHRDAWTEGELVCQFLERAKRWITTTGDTGSTSRLMVTPETLADQDGLPVVDHRLIRLFLELPAVLGRMQSSSSGNGFFHPDYVDILIQMSNHLTEENALALLDYYEREGVCLPPTEKWTGNINRILNAFYIIHPKDRSIIGGKGPSTTVRQRTAELVFKHVYSYVVEDSVLRNQLVQDVVLSLAEKTLLAEADPVIERMFWQVMVDFVSTDSIEKDEERRAHRHKLEQAGEPVPALSVAELVEGDSFDRLRALSLACLSQPCEQHGGSLTRNNSERRESAPRVARERPSRPTQSRSEADEDHSRSNSAGISLKGIMEAISPTSTHRELPPISTRTGPLSPRSEMDETISPRAESINETSRPETSSPEHMNSSPCKHTATITTAITVFNRLAFSLPSSSGPARLSRLPASARCIIIFKDLVRLMAVPANASAHDRTASPAIPRPEAASDDEFKEVVICPKARLAILQWSLRLRATQEHRIWMRQNLDIEAANSSAALSRLQTQVDAIKIGKPVEEADARRRGARPENVAGDRGRLDRSMQDGTGRSRSRSRQPLRTTPYHPLWTIPDRLDFECPKDERPSEGMTTFDPRLTDSGSGDASGPLGIWLPISEYLSVLCDILEADSDWDMVSYLLVFLPLQLANRHFYCGPRAKIEIRRLRRLLCDGLLGDRLIHNVQLPAMLRRADIRGVAYQMLTILISYKSLFDRSECNSIVEALSRGLSGIHRSTTKPCVRALTVAAYELTDNLVTYLPGILEQLSQIMGTPSTSLHILEFLCSIGQIRALYGNFTDIQYKAVFQVAMRYIELHHGDENKAIADAAQAQDPGYATLSQHVLKLSFFVIYTWYMALALPKRVELYPHILRQLILCFPKQFDEMAEVCFDWLTRYTYGNADPKPASSHIGAVAMHNSGRSPLATENNRTKYWLLGNSVLSVTAHPRSGWATLNVRRASGTVGMLIKIENVPTITLGEDGADLDVLPAMMRADRPDDKPVYQESLPVSPSGENENNKEVALEQVTDNSVIAVTPYREADSQFEFIWSGSAPSQRRKDVVIDPSFLGIQLSAYPYISATTPRGRFLPLDSTVERTLRNLDRIPVIDTQAIAVLYVGPGQTTEDEILSNTSGSPGFLRFMAGLGRLIKLKGQRDVFTGGLDTQEDRDGEYAYAWWDDLIQVIYHAPHLMPNPVTEPGAKPNYFTKKREVGNDYVKIVFNDSGLDYAFDTIKSQFQFINIVISQHTPGLSGTFKDQTEDNFYQVTIQKAPGIPDFAAIGDFKLISVKTLPLVVRQIGYYATVLSQLHLHTSTEGNLEYLTAWRQRWQKIQSLKNYLPKPPTDEEMDSMNDTDRRELLRDFTRGF